MFVFTICSCINKFVVKRFFNDDDDDDDDDDGDGDGDGDDDDDNDNDVFSLWPTNFPENFPTQWLLEAHYPPYPQ